MSENQTFLLLTFDVVSLYLFYVFFWLSFYRAKSPSFSECAFDFYRVLYFFQIYTKARDHRYYIHIYSKHILENVNMRIHKAFEPIICIVVAEQHVH